MGNSIRVDEVLRIHARKGKVGNGLRPDSSHEIVFETAAQSSDLEVAGLLPSEHFRRVSDLGVEQLRTKSANSMVQRQVLNHGPVVGRPTFQVLERFSVESLECRITFPVEEREHGIFHMQK